MGFEGGQMPLFRRVARRGFSNYPFKAHYTTVAVGALEVFSAGDTVNRQSLVDRGIVRPKVGLIKILGNGSLTKKLVVDVDKVTAGARKAIEGAGGTVVSQAGAREAEAKGAPAPGGKTGVSAPAAKKTGKAAKATSAPAPDTGRSDPEAAADEPEADAGDRS